MKHSRVLGTVAFIALVAGARSTASAQPQEVVKREVAAFNAHDATAVANFHAPDATLTVLPKGKVLSKGTAQTRVFFAKVFKSNPQEQLTLDKQYVFNNMVV